MKRKAPSGPFDPAPLRLQTYVGPLKSTDFGAQYNGPTPEQRVARLALPPPTELIRLPVALKTETAVFLEAQASKRTFDYRAAALAHGASAIAASTAAAIVTSAIAVWGRLGRLRASETSRRTLAAGRTVAAFGARAVRRSLSLSRHALYVGAQRTLETLMSAKRFAMSTLDTAETFDGGRECVLSIQSELRAKACETGTESARLEAGARVTVFLGFHTAPDGWVLAQASGGEVGFLRLEHLRFMTPSVREDLG